MIEALGVVKKVQQNEMSLSLSIASDEIFKHSKLGASISINGVCLSQTQSSQGIATFDVVQETLNKTNLGLLKEGDLVNLEQAMQVGARIDGHLVQGHIDGVGHIRCIDQKNREIWIDVPDHLQQYLVQKGSIAIDGISLTIAEVEGKAMRIALIPLTWEKTNFKTRKEKDVVNLEIDMIAKYTLKYIEGRPLPEESVL